MLPQVGVGGETPSPMKLRLASIRIAPAARSPLSTTISPRMLRRMWPARIRQAPAPTARAASTNSWRTRERVVGWAEPVDGVLDDGAPRGDQRRGARPGRDPDREGDPGDRDPVAEERRPHLLALRARPAHPRGSLSTGCAGR